MVCDNWPCGQANYHSLVIKGVGTTIFLTLAMILSVPFFW